MGTEDSHKSLKTTKQKMKKNRKCHEKKKPKINETEQNFYRVKEETEKNKSLGQKWKGREKGSETEAAKVDQYSSEDVSKKARKSKKKARLSSRKDENLLDRREEPEQTEVYEMSSGDEDYSRGMKKLITEYQQSIPGLKILQLRIDDFMTDFEAQEEQARKEREALAAEGGWTVVVHHKGRKKTTDAETGVTVGSVAQTAVLDNMAKKKSKDVGLDFYRFQKRESQRNEIMVLQSKFEQDKKRYSN
ncbi:uncharacterized protein LOC130777263 isoform X2 [Actinidia eriantha]|uniref:uncharacterized protein LOC130777263 isoform X2 n=1 Tax=Actinidia eriantha TaxID=165200 RepID=UPI00258FEC7D|nr:uncharacterized protein LOC130777263 isoform X2 [Actinidia eriantha]